MRTNNYTQFTQVSYSGRKLLENHSLNEYGIWEIRGEDRNCDWGGSHHNPYIGTYEGKLEDIITFAVELPGFWNWGSGGEITKVNVEKIDPKTIADRNKLRNRLKELEAETAEIKKTPCL